MVKKLLFGIVSLLIFSMGRNTLAQCPPDLMGQNLVVNGDFEMGDTLFSTPYGSWNDPTDAVPCPGNIDPTTCPRFWSSPGEYFIDTDANNFNPGSFSSVPSPVSGGNMMLVDAECDPGAVVWEQTVEVTASSNYYFSLWIASIHGTAPAKLAFEVNGVALGTLVNAPATTNNWLFYEDVWNSGALNGPVQLRIIEQSGVGCTNGDDFAIDDISFIGGCQYGAAGPVPDLGADQTLCGKGGSITLDANVPHNATTTVTWSTGATGTGAGAPYTINVATPGTYSVCVTDNGSCLRSDVIEITDDYSVNLGPNRNLCSPPTITLNAGYTGPGVTYLWTLNGSPLPGATNPTYDANQTGTYTVQVTDPVCGTREDEIEITSSTITANNGQFCATPSSVNLSVNGSGGTYNWYDAPVGGTLLQSNSTTYTTPPISITTTYYVEDASTFSYNVGPTAQLAGWGRSGNLSNHYLRFDASTSFVLDFVTVHAYNGWNSNFTVQVVLADNTGAVLASSTPFAVTGSANTTQHQIPVGITVPVGTNLRMYAVTSGGQIHYDGNTHPTGNWPYQVAGVVNIHTNVSDGVATQNSYNHLYDWVISSGAICDRVPVEAVQFCPPACDPPSAATISNPSPVVMCTGGNVILNANHEPGYEYTWIRNGTAIAGPTVDLFDYTATQTGTYSVRITEAGNPFCFLQSSSITVVEFDISAVDLIPDYSTCDPSQTLDAIVTGTGVTYIWEKNAAVIPGADDQTYTIDDLGAYRVWVNHPVCGMATDVVVVSPGTYNINLGSDRDLCTPTSYTLDAGFTAAGVTYQWQSPVGTDITDATNQTLFVNAPGTYAVVVDHPFCGQKTDDITITSSLGTPVNDDFCSTDASDNTAELSIIGPGPYEWYDVSTGGVSLGTGNNYTTPVLGGTTTYYVESTASFKLNKGPKDRFEVIDPSSGFPTKRYTDMANPYGMSGSSHYIEFTALTDMTFDSVSLYFQNVQYGDGVFNVTFNVRNVTDGVDNLVSRAVPNPDFGIAPNDATPRSKIPFQIDVPLVSGKTYRIWVNTSDYNAVRWQPDSGPLIPINSAVFDEPGSVDFIDYGSRYGCNCQYPGFFDFVFSSGVPCDRVPVMANDMAPCDLPVSWLDFTATSRNTNVLLEWSTATETSNDYFTVQRSSDGIHWQAIGQVDGNGNTNLINKYHFTDPNPLQGTSYYRIAQQDFDGSAGYSAIRTVNRETFLINVLPNPFSESTTVEFSSSAKLEVDIEVVDMNGKTVFSKHGHSTTQSIELGQDLASGLYVLKVMYDTNVEIFKVVKN